MSELRKSMYILLVGVSPVLFAIFPSVAYSLPSINSVQCDVNYELRDQSASVGALEDTACLLRLGLGDFYSSRTGFQRNTSGEVVFGCKLKKGETSCVFSESELRDINDLIRQVNFNPRLLGGTTFSDRSDLERKHGCVQRSQSDTLVYPLVIPTPAIDTGRQIGTKCSQSSACALTITYQYDCLSLPEAEPDPTPTPTPTPDDPDVFRQCRNNYQGCVSDNLQLQVRLGECRGGLALIVPLTNFSGGLADCEEHLNACALSTFQMNQAVSDCELRAR